MRSEVNYLCLQLESLHDRAGAFERVTSAAGVAPDEMAASNPDDYQLLSDPVGDVLSGYTLAETGTVCIATDDVVIASDDERIPAGSNLRTALGESAYSAIATSMSANDIQPVPLEGALADSGGDRDGYLLAGQQIAVTVDALKGWIADAENRMDAELATAKAIQESALPRTFPAFPDISKFDLFASMDAAREVGGDFYDFFLVGKNNTPETGALGFLMADVSGKGVPAALFMMKAKALIRDYINSGMSLSKAVTEANRSICDGNDAGMFVTAWIGVLDYATGHLEYVNAGHNPPLMWRQESGWQWIRERSGVILGLFGREYEAFSIECEPGDALLLYTDGVTEARDVDGAMYGEGRLLALLEEHGKPSPQELQRLVRDDIAAYAEGAEQFDDITILALEVR